MYCPPLRTIIGCSALALVLQASSAQAGDFMDVRLSFNITDENVLVKPGETVPSIPGVRVGAPIPRWSKFFYDTYETRDRGFENLSYLVLSKLVANGQDDYVGAFILKLNTLSDNIEAVNDGGSYLKWIHWFDPTRAEKANLSLTAFPLSSNQFTLGYSRSTAWGGSPIFFKINPDNPFGSAGSSNPAAVPGARVQFSNELGYAFIGGKTSQLLNKEINEQEAVYAVLGGAGADVTDMLRIEANGGFFDRGVNPTAAVLGKPVQTYGGSTQVMVHEGMAADRSVDWHLFQNDPSSASTFFRAEEYPGGLSWLVAAEASYTQTTLQDPTKTASTTAQPGMAAALNFRMKLDRLRVRANVAYRDLSFVLINVPGFVPFQALPPETTKSKPEIFAAAGADYNFEALKLTVGITGGAEMPARFEGQLPDSLTNGLPAEAIPSTSTVVVRSEGAFDILPPGYEVAPIYGGKLTGMLALSDTFQVVADIMCSYDNNVTHLQRINADPQLVFTRVFNDPWQLGFNIALQARI